MKQFFDANSPLRVDLDLWITLGRGLLAIALGLLMILAPDISNHLLGNFIGGFWIGMGILSIRWGLADERSKPLTLVMGAVAVIAGALAYSRGLLRHWIPEATVMTMLAIVAILTGLLHLSGQLPVSRVHNRNAPRSRGLLGTFEIGLGIMILGHRRSEMYWVMVAWALIGGIIILGDAVFMRRQLTHTSKNLPASDEVVDEVVDEPRDSR